MTLFGIRHSDFDIRNSFGNSGFGIAISPQHSAFTIPSCSFIQPLKLHVVLPVREVEVLPVDLHFASLEIERLAAEGCLGRLEGEP